MRALISFFIASLFMVTAHAHDMKTKTGLVIEHPWAKVSIPGARMSAAYLEIENNSESDDRLIAVSVDGVTKVEIHEMRMDGDMMMMQRLPDGLLIPAGGYVSLQPGGYHLMLMGLMEPLVDGALVKGTLTFAQAGVIEVMFMVEPLTKADERAEANLSYGNMQRESMNHGSDDDMKHDQMGASHSSH